MGKYSIPKRKCVVKIKLIPNLFKSKIHGSLQIQRCTIEQPTNLSGQKTASTQESGLLLAIFWINIGILKVANN